MKKLVYMLQCTQEKLKGTLYEYLKNLGMNPICNDGFLYAEGDIPVLLVAHMDTVFEPPKKLFYYEERDMIYNPDDGLGGDDRCGIYAITELLKNHRPHVLFTEDEEIGCIGAMKAVRALKKPDVKYIIEIDRRGKDDCVFYGCGNKKFMEYVEKFGFKKEYGSCSDISILGPDWDIAAVNLSSGYYNEHTEDEFIVFNHLRATIDRVDKMLKAIDKAPHFDFQEYPRFSAEDFRRLYDSNHKQYMKAKKKPKGGNN